MNKLTTVAGFHMNSVRNAFDEACGVQMVEYFIKVIDLAIMLLVFVVFPATLLGSEVNYTVQVVDEFGYEVSSVEGVIYEANQAVGSLKTGRDGVATFKLNGAADRSLEVGVRGFVRGKIALGCSALQCVGFVSLKIANFPSGGFDSEKILEVQSYRSHQTCVLRLLNVHTGNQLILRLLYGKVTTSSSLRGVVYAEAFCQGMPSIRTLLRVNHADSRIIIDDK